MVSTKDVGIVVALAALAGIIVFGGRELFKALPSIGGFFNQAGKDTGQFVFNLGQGAGETVFDAGKSFGDFIGSTQNQIDQALSNFFKVAKSDIDIGLSNFQKDVEEKLKALGFNSVVLDPEGYRMGSLNAALEIKK